MLLLTRRRRMVSAAVLGSSVILSVLGPALWPSRGELEAEEGSKKSLKTIGVRQAAGLTALVV
jgi:hypothetical protein